MAALKARADRSYHMQLSEIKKLLAKPLAATDALIDINLECDVPLITEVCRHIIESGGKRLRPLLVLIVAAALSAESPHQVELASIIEFIHTATLLHDDVVDNSSLRRGQETANDIWGNQTSVLVGDFLLSRSFQSMVRIGNMDLLALLSQATNEIAAGEVLQLTKLNKPETTEADYLAVITAKTATLFAAAAKGAAILAGADKQIQTQLADYGRNLGIAFQLVDDALDYDAVTDTLGKAVGDDLAEGKPTLPLIHLLQRGDDATKATVTAAIKHGNRDNLPVILQAIESAGSITYTYDLAQSYADKARTCLSGLAQGPFLVALESLCDIAVKRVA